MSEALQSARELLSDAIEARRPKVPEELVIADEDGRALEVVPIATVLPTSLNDKAVSVVG